MSIEDIKKRILDKAESEANLIVNKARERIKEEKNTFENEQKAIFSERAQKEIEKIRSDLKKRIDQEKLKESRAILKKKNELLEGLFSEVIEKIASLPKKQYKKFLVDLIMRDAPKGKSVLFLNKKDMGLFTEKVISEINKSLGKEREITLGTHTVDIKGGFMLKGEEVEIDDSLETIVKDVKEKEEIRISKELFGDV